MLQLVKVHVFLVGCKSERLLYSHTTVDAQRSCANKKSITFAYIAAKSGALVTSGAKAAVDLALEEINSRNDILPNYTLSYSTIRDSEVQIKHKCIVYCACYLCVCTYTV